MPNSVMPSMPIVAQVRAQQTWGSTLNTAQICRKMLHILGEELIPYRYSSCSCCCWWSDSLQKNPLRLRRFKSDRDEISADCSWSKYTHLLTESSFDLTSHFQDAGHDVISRRKVLPSGEYTRSVPPADATAYAARYSNSVCRSWSIRTYQILTRFKLYHILHVN